MRSIGATVCLGISFQPDKINMMNRAKFLQNGKCGYLLRPGFMLTNEKYNLKEETEDKKVIKIQIFVSILL